MKLLDPAFVPPFICRCAQYNGDVARPLADTTVHILTCQEIGDEFEIYEVDYCDGKINHAELLHKYSKNLLDGCVR